MIGRHRGHGREHGLARLSAWSSAARDAVYSRLEEMRFGRTMILVAGALVVAGAAFAATGAAFDDPPRRRAPSARAAAPSPDPTPTTPSPSRHHRPRSGATGMPSSRHPVAEASRRSTSSTTRAPGASRKHREKGRYPRWPWPWPWLGGEHHGHHADPKHHEYEHQGDRPAQQDPYNDEDRTDRYRPSPG